ncbi:hypothetical protein F2Q68_00033906 [Brassica cretica]|uniref:Uncharacterized protein n=1 Tax=Brassica cretica TaxID=69181 RepID=A0A8S9H579_BRACR|nr:hypothetical protein F2Q68_00033906 [Brassica cretica]
MCIVGGKTAACWETSIHLISAHSGPSCNETSCGLIISGPSLIHLMRMLIARSVPHALTPFCFVSAARRLV